MDYEILAAKNEQFIEAAALYIDVLNRKGIVTKEFASKLAAYRLPLSVMIGDEHVGLIAERTLEAVNAALDYIESKDENDLKRMVDAHKAADVLINKLRVSVAMDGVYNGT